MNGRVYDPVLGRFLSADPYVDDAHDSQAFNRYSYVSNNPLNHTDPSGYFKLGDALKIVAIVAIAFVTAGAALVAAAAIVGQAGVTFAIACQAMVGAGGLGLTTAGAVVAGAAGGFASGFAGSLLNGGSIGDAFKSGAIGAVVGGITGGLANKIGGLYQDGVIDGPERAMLHGTLQGAASEAQGGQFRHGFYAGFFTAVASPSNMIEASVVGGTASAIGGGKFANGAVSGAFQFLLNDSQHEKTSSYGVRKWYDYAAVSGIGMLSALTSSENGSRAGVDVLLDKYLNSSGLSNDRVLLALGGVSSAAGDAAQATAMIYSVAKAGNPPTGPVPETPTGRIAPATLQEQIAMKQAFSSPEKGMVLPMKMTDPRWPANDGWVKMSQNVYGVEIHYVRNTNTGAVGDYKFKD